MYSFARKRGILGLINDWLSSSDPQGYLLITAGTGFPGLPGRHKPLVTDRHEAVTILVYGPPKGLSQARGFRNPCSRKC
eukprot:3508262-Amphidinium_carterae.1